MLPVVPPPPPPPPLLLAAKLAPLWYAAPPAPLKPLLVKNLALGAGECGGGIPGGAPPPLRPSAVASF